jgi:uncharacterized protein YrrD
MITKFQLQKDAAVLAEDGKKIGSLERVVVNTIDNVITDIVVRTGGMLNAEEKIVSVELIGETAEDKILLKKKAGTLESCPPFEEKQLVSEDGRYNQGAAPGNIPAAMGGMPAVGTSAAQVSGEKIVTRMEQNIPEGTIAMKIGAKVTSADGKHIGNVERVLAEPIRNQIMHFVVPQGLLNVENKSIPIEWVMRIGEEAIHLKAEKSEIEDLVEAPDAG